MIAKPRGEIQARTSENTVLSRGTQHPHVKRLDIQGLRAVAVIVVVLNHLTGQPVGGFVGVDVFFVISGYLITGLLLRDLTSHPSLIVFLTAFYKRRIRRLLPAALVVTGVTLLFAHAIFAQPRFAQTGTDALWATFFLANWHFIATGTNYFAATSPPSPFQHYWTLSVEEQFYLVWPVLLFSIVAAAKLMTSGTHSSRRSSRRARSAKASGASGYVLLPIALVLAASLVYAFHETKTAPVAAYFSTFARAWELALGALIACAAKYLKPQRVTGTVLSWLGLGLIIASLFVIKDNSQFPAPGALLPCVGAALVLFAGSWHQVSNPLLTNRVSGLVGDMSYSIYLVHYPIIILLETEMPGKALYFYLCALTLIAGTASLSYYAIERTVLRSNFLAGTRRSEVRPQFAMGRRYSSAGSAPIVVGAGLTFLGAAIFTFWPGTTAANNARYKQINDKLIRSAVSSKQVERQSGLGTLGVALQHQIRQALVASTWPKLDPPMDYELSAPDVPNPLDGCGSIELQPASACLFGPQNAANTLYVVGDSTAMADAEAYLKIVQHSPGWNLRIAAAYGCNFDTVLISNVSPSIMSGCARHNAAVIADINRTRPSVVVVTNTYSPRVSAATAKVLSDKQWTGALDGEIAKITSGSRIVLVEPAPLGTDPNQCYQPHGDPTQCVYSIPSTHLSRANAERELAHAKGWSYVNTEGWYCDIATGYCPAFADGVPIKHDVIHVGAAYDDLIWPVVREALHAIGIL